jgi:hypothetical protein
MGHLHNGKYYRSLQHKADALEFSMDIEVGLSTLIVRKHHTHSHAHAHTHTHAQKVKGTSDRLGSRRVKKHTYIHRHRHAHSLL